MDKIVTAGMKIDLHIHSHASSAKDGSKVRNNTISNIPLLVDKLNDNGVNVCAITDHDVFSYEIYLALKEAEKLDNSIKKVLPGVEFSVKFDVDGVLKTVHIVTIFSDAEDVKVKSIEQILNKTKVDKDGGYTEEDFLNVLREINIDTILIAHQKKSLSSDSLKTNDANSLGNRKFNEFIFTDYFEAFEFKNKRNEVINKSFLNQNRLEERVRFISGTDCHDWNYYPFEDMSDVSTEFPFSYAKCLPTFRGLVMAITDHRRLKMVNSFFNVDKQCAEKIAFKSHGKNFEIALSRGINVIIGDNSIGKSMLLHTLTDFNKNLSSSVKKGYKKYLDKNELEVLNRFSQKDIFCFDMQGEIRTKFEENKIDSAEFLENYFPEKVDPKPYRNIIDNEIKRMIEYLKRKFELDKLIRGLGSISVIVTESKAESLIFLLNLRNIKKKTKTLAAISSKIDEVIGELKELQKMKIDEGDKENIFTTLQQFISMKKKYDNRIKDIDVTNERIETIHKIIHKVSESHKKDISDEHKKNSSFIEVTDSIVQQYKEIIRKTRELSLYEPCIETAEIPANKNCIYCYEFISKLNIEKIDTGFLKSLISSVLKAKTNINWGTINESKLQEILIRYDNETPVLDFFQEKLLEKLDVFFSSKRSIICQGMDKFDEMSSGLDARIYFDLLSHESIKGGIYIIDQPEDNVSQNAIKTYLLDRFKTMGENRQIIMVTHNPQFIINLDVDNLIFITANNNSLEIQSGALEYVTDECDILKIVAENIDGGLDTIQRRWKRYEKAANI